MTQLLKMLENVLIIEVFYVLLDVFTNQLKDRFKDFSKVVQKFRILDPKFFIEKSFNVRKDELTNLADMYESDLDKENLFSEFKSFSSLYKQSISDSVISELHKIGNLLEFIETNDMSSVFPNLKQLLKI